MVEGKGGLPLQLGLQFAAGLSFQFCGFPNVCFCFALAHWSGTPQPEDLTVGQEKLMGVERAAEVASWLWPVKMKLCGAAHGFSSRKPGLIMRMGPFSSNKPEHGCELMQCGLVRPTA